MTAHLAPRSFPAASNIARSLGNKSTGTSEMSFRLSRGALDPEDAERAWFASLLWKAFPEARSENDLATLAAEVLTQEGRTVEPRTVRNWLRQENSPHFRYVIRVLAIAGAESLFQIIDPERPQ